jgi:hypothetical protein
MRGVWAEHFEKAVDLIWEKITSQTGQIESQEYFLSCGRVNGIGPKVMKQAAAKLGIVFERHVNPDTGFDKTYWRLPTIAKSGCQFLRKVTEPPSSQSRTSKDRR